MITKDVMRSYIVAGLASIGRTDEVRNTDTGVAVFGLDYRIVMEADSIALISDSVSVSEAITDGVSEVKAKAMEGELVRVANDEAGCIEVTRKLVLDVAEFMLDVALQAHFDHEVEKRESVST